MTLFAVAAHLILLHLPGGHVVEIAPWQVTSLRHQPPREMGHYTPEASCLVSLTDGKYFAVIEDCDRISKMIEEAK